MGESTDPSPAYIKAFNQGYTFSKHDTQTLETLIRSIDDKSVIGKALRAGQKQFELENLKEQTHTNFKSRER